MVPSSHEREFDFKSYDIPFSLSGVLVKSSIAMKNLLYFLPFFFFILGYYALAWLTQVNSVYVPPLIGLSVPQAVMSLAEQQLNLRIMAFHEEPDIAPGTIINQIPTAGSSSKPHQRVFVVVAQEPETYKIPHLVGILQDQAQQIAKKQGLQLKHFLIANSIYPTNMVIAQSPAPGEIAQDKMVVAYVSHAGQQLMLMPNSVGLPVATVQQFCEQQGITLETLYASAYDARQGTEHSVVRHQRPLAGSIVDTVQPLRVQISIAAA